jgi:phosphoglycerate dehydrogenase-like enzyme
MLIWKNTSTLAGFEEGLNFTNQKKVAEIAVLGSKSISLKEFPKLKGIFRAGISTDNVPTREAEDLDIMIRYPSQKTKDIIYEETANFTCSLIFKVFFSETGTVDPWRKQSRTALSQNRLLVIGMGNIGKRVYKKMHPFMEVDSFDIIHNEVMQLEEKMRNAYVISLHIPMSDENSSFIDTQKLSWMQENSVLINTARANLVNEDALYIELISGRLRAAFDVFWTEPYQGKLMHLPENIFLKTPHVASNCVEFRYGCRVDLDKMTEKIKGNQTKTF